MDIWKFFDITHREHIVCNPTGQRKIAQLVDLLRLPAGSLVVDIASGKAEFLMQLAEKYDVRCTGVDLSPHFVAQARERMAHRGLERRITLVEMDGAEYHPEKPQSLALASCLGGSWIFGGHAGTLDALCGMTAPGGWVIAGEPYWIHDPPDEYIEMLGEPRESIGTHESNARCGVERDLELVYTIVSSHDDWDRYEGLQWYAAAAYARENPNDPDLAEIAEQIEKGKLAYLKWGREMLGWAIYVFRKR